MKKFFILFSVLFLLSFTNIASAKESAKKSYWTYIHEDLPYDVEAEAITNSAITADTTSGTTTAKAN